MNKQVGRNDPCPCGSGKKFKKCCEKNALGGHTAKVISSTSQNSLLGKITAAGASFAATKEEKAATRVLNASLQNPPVKESQTNIAPPNPASEASAAETNIKSETTQEKD